MIEPQTKLVSRSALNKMTNLASSSRMNQMGLDSSLSPSRQDGVFLPNQGSPQAGLLQLGDATGFNWVELEAAGRSFRCESVANWALWSSNSIVLITARPTRSCYCFSATISKISFLPSQSGATSPIPICSALDATHSIRVCLVEVK